MFKYFDLILVATILIVITIVISMKLIQGPILIAMVALVMPFLVIPLYRKCTSSRKKLQKYTFWSSYWYDIKCKLLVIPFILFGALFVTWIK